MKNYMSILIAIYIMLFLTGCATNSMEMMTLSESSAQERQLQTRSFDTANETNVLSASTATLQDLGFNIDEIDRQFGLITCSKVRDAKQIDQQVIGLLFAIFDRGVMLMNADDKQTIRATVVTTPRDAQNKINVRLNIMRIVTNKRGSSRIETINDSEIYNEFFDRLSKAIFLEGNNI
ncbi:MAG: hypothetical protein LBF71_01880 [Campylobacteraceae bacterium]|jgi:hypothetical protein|nr:hypothetical protein [Campylobacteraceae bacterium]